MSVVRPFDPAYHEELSNQEHPNTVNKKDELLGHIPLKMAVFVSKFLKRGNYKGKTVVTGKRVNREEPDTAWKFLVKWRLENVSPIAEIKTRVS